MSGRISVRLEKLAQHAEDLDALMTRLQKHLTQLDSAVRRVTEGWEGEAQDAFGAYYRKWRTASGDLHGALRDLHKILTTAHGNYAAAHTANQRMWGGR
ncbi:WXG100 family type VII secretion target [Streptomyces sp. HPF1205]|uniref:WXG100 family type VII secretion target n=1 Tax=Streptomyces sp. HPF1205 TaxID=2873262 RepID=UPI001CED2E2B|nr:WXG100 family type VII secretion target [Streptomyces sp. HPF1205]